MHTHDCVAGQSRKQEAGEQQHTEGAMSSPLTVDVKMPPVLYIARFFLECDKNADCTPCLRTLTQYCVTVNRDGSRDVIWPIGFPATWIRLLRCDIVSRDIQML